MPRNVHIIGPFNSGTNLVFKIINNSECIDLTDNTSVHITDQHKPFGKHTIDISVIENYLYEPSNLLIIMYKNVYNWLYSIKKEHYSLNYTKLYLPVELSKKKFSNMVELHNFYYINYMSILQRYPNAIFLDYNKVIDKSISYNYINNKLSKINLSINSAVNFNKTLMKPSKTHGNPVKNTDEAKQQYNNVHNMVKKFVQKIPNLNRSIKRSNLIKYYENI
jgi:hypothetical protein